MANEIIQAGNKIEMRPVQRWNADVSQEPLQPYVSQFIEWVDYNIAVILVPLYQGQLLAVRQDDYFDLCFYTKGGLYQCRAVVTKRFRKENIALAEVKLVSALEKFQRRQFYRMNCIAPLSYAVLSSEQLDLYVDLKYCMFKECPANT